MKAAVARGCARTLGVPGLQRASKPPDYCGLGGFVRDAIDLSANIKQELGKLIVPIEAAYPFGRDPSCNGLDRTRTLSRQLECVVEPWHDYLMGLQKRVRSPAHAGQSRFLSMDEE